MCTTHTKDLPHPIRNNTRFISIQLWFISFSNRRKKCFSSLKIIPFFHSKRFIRFKKRRTKFLFCVTVDDRIWHTAICIHSYHFPLIASIHGIVEHFTMFWQMAWHWLIGWSYYKLLPDSDLSRQPIRIEIGSVFIVYYTIYTLFFVTHINQMT